MPLFKLFTATGDDEIKAVVDGAVASLVREVEPRLGNAAPFFGGQEKLGLAEVCLPLVLCVLFSGWVLTDRTGLDRVVCDPPSRVVQAWRISLRFG